MTTNEQMRLLFGPGPAGTICRGCKNLMDAKICKLATAKVYKFYASCGKYEEDENEK